MTDTTAKIIPYDPSHLDEILELTVLAWSPVFPLMKKETPDYVYNAFYPDGWKARQRSDVLDTCQDSEANIWVAMTENKVSGFMGLNVHQEDSMGEIYVIAVHPEYQRQGIASALMSFAFDWFRQHDMKIVMVETGGDEGHANSRATYESVGFERYPTARYFRKL